MNVKKEHQFYACYFNTIQKNDKFYENRPIIIIMFDVH